MLTAYNYNDKGSKKSKSKLNDTAKTDIIDCGSFKQFWPPDLQICYFPLWVGLAAQHYCYFRSPIFYYIIAYLQKLGSWKVVFMVSGKINIFYCDIEMPQQESKYVDDKAASSQHLECHINPWEIPT